MKATQEYAKDLIRWANDPWEWIKDCVRTLDENDANNPIKPFPTEKKYLQIMCKIWTRERLVAIPKSRQMMASWLMVSLHLWDVWFNKGRLIGCMSKKEDVANELLKRMKFIHDHVPEDVWPKELRPKLEFVYCEVRNVDFGSRIVALPEGADQARSYTFSRLLCDEMAFWDNAQATYSAAIPTLGAHGCLTAISSAAPSFFHDIVFDCVDGEVPKTPPKIYRPIDGVEIWRNEKNGFVVVQIHYSADKSKYTDEVLAQKKASMPYHQWMQEYEISWETKIGKPVYPDWSKKVHATSEIIHPHLGLPLILSIDQGLYPAALVSQYQEGRWVCLKEYIQENMGAERFCEYVITNLRKDFRDWCNLKEDFITFIDPTAFNRRDVDERTYVTVFAKFFKVQPGANGFNERVQSVETLLTTMKHGRPCFLVSEPGCPELVKGFDGKYHYPEKYFEKEPNKIRPEKNFWSNIHDALQYGVSGFMRFINKKPRVGVKSPGYRFGGEIYGSEGR
jgi:hypothetical protein